MNILIKRELTFTQLYDLLGPAALDVLERISQQGQEEKALQIIADNFHVSGFDQAALLPTIEDIDDFIRWEIETLLKREARTNEINQR